MSDPYHTDPPICGDAHHRHDGRCELYDHRRAAGMMLGVAQDAAKLQRYRITVTAAVDSADAIGAYEALGHQLLATARMRRERPTRPYIGIDWPMVQFEVTAEADERQQT